MTWAHRLIEADWLDTGPADPVPWADAAELTPRLNRARALGYSHLLVYGDRDSEDALPVRSRGHEGVRTLSLDALVSELATL